MNDLFLGIIAVSVLVMAIVQVALIVFVAQTSRRLGDAVSRLDADLRPVVDNLKAATADAARVSASAVAQVERMQRTVETLSARFEETIGLVQEQILGPMRDGLAFLQGFKSVVSLFREIASRPSGRPRPSHVDEEDALFIG